MPIALALVWSSTPSGLTIGTIHSVFSSSQLGESAPLAVASAQEGLAEDPGLQPSPGMTEEETRELREEMRHYFYNRLRHELSLSDEQMENMVPALEELEAIRRSAARERRDTVRQLQCVSRW